MEYLFQSTAIISPWGTWREGYFQDPTLRITYLVKDAVPLETWDALKSELQKLVLSRQLLLRMKSFLDDKTLIITQVWRAREDLKNSVVHSEYWPLFCGALERQGFIVKTSESIMSEEDIRKEILSRAIRPFNVQVSSEPFNRTLRVATDSVKRLPSGHRPYQTAADAQDDRLLFADLYLPELPKERIIKALRAAPKAAWVYDEYRNTSLLSLMTVDGRADKEGIRNKASDSYLWTEFAPQEMKTYFEEHVWPWMKVRSRIMVLKTPAGCANFEHIDCSPQKFGTRQLKFRIVLQGRTDTLYFITKNQDRIFIPATERPFLIDGSWPHGMMNSDNEEKWTLCVGAPWEYSDNYPFFRQSILKDPYELPSDYSRYFNPKYQDKY